MRYCSCWMIVSKVKKYGKESWQLALYNKLDNMNLMTVGTAHWSAFGPPLMIWKVYSPKLGRNYINKCVARWVINNALLFPVEWSFLKWKKMAESWQLALYNKFDNMNLMTVGTAHWSAFGPPLLIWKVYSPTLGRWICRRSPSPYSRWLPKAAPPPRTVMQCKHHPLTWFSPPAEAVYRGVALGASTWEI